MIKEYIKRYFFARAVCRKYGLKFKQTSDVGYINHARKEVGCSVFDNHFYTTLLHEIGHYVDGKIVPFQCRYPSFHRMHKLKVFPESVGDFELNEVLDREAKASRFALRALKKINKHTEEAEKHLSWAIGTYTRGIPVEHKADVMYTAQRYIQSRF